MIWLTSRAQVKPPAVRADALVVGPDLTETPRMTACPSCGASVRPDAAFCGQCYADFRPKPAAPPPPVPPTAPAPSAVYGVPAGDPLTAPLLDFLPALPAEPATPVAAAAPVVPAAEATEPTEPTWPCLSCQAPNALSVSECGTCGSPFLAEVAATGKPSLVLPVVGDLQALSRGQRALVAAGAVLVVLLPLALVTMLLTGSPPPAEPTQPSAPGTTVTTTP